MAHSNLGGALREHGKLDDAITEYRKAIRLRPDFAEGHINLGLALRDQGTFAEAVVELHKARDLEKANPGLVKKIDGDLSIAEGQAALAALLPGVLQGRDQPKNAADRLGFGLLCHTLKRYSASARLIAEAFQADRRLAEDMKVQNRYNGACSAALAGCGEGKDQPPLDEAARTRWRTQAIVWLNSDLAFWTKQVEAGPQQARAAVSQILQHWKADADLVGIRERSYLAKLPEDERKACRAASGLRSMHCWANVVRRHCPELC